MDREYFGRSLITLTFAILLTACATTDEQTTTSAAQEITNNSVEKSADINSAEGEAAGMSLRASYRFKS